MHLNIFYEVTLVSTWKMNLRFKSLQDICIPMAYINVIRKFQILFCAYRVCAGCNDAQINYK